MKKKIFLKKNITLTQLILFGLGVGDQINFGSITILAKYSDGSEETKTVSSTSSIKHNGADISTATPGNKTLTITFMGKTCEHVFEVKEIVVVRLEVTNANLNVVEGNDFDPTGMTVNKVFNNGGKIPVDINELEITQNGDVVTIKLGSVSTTLNLNVQDPSVTSLTLDTTNFTSKILVGDSFNTSAVSITGNLNNGLSEIVPISDVTFSTVDTSVAGTYTITVSYNADPTITATLNVTVLDIKSITIDASTIDTFFPAGTEFDYSGLKVMITASDDSIHFKGIADGVTVNTDNLDATTIGDEYYITASYRGVTSAQQNIVVHDPDLTYAIIDVDLPTSITAQPTYQSNFMVKNNPYVVGDDNPFVFKLNLTILNDAGELVEDFDSYNSYFEIYIVENETATLLTGDALSTYVEEINAAKNSIDFTEAAIGKTFTIKTRPADGIVESDIENMTREFTVKIVDALNIYEAWELNYLTNYDGDFSIPDETRSRPQIALDFLKTKNPDATIPSIAGAVIHNNLTVKHEDIPSVYFHSSGNFYDFLTVFPHATDKNNPSFTFYGNYFTIYSYELPEVCERGQGNQDDDVSSGQLFRFSCSELNATDFAIDQYTTKIQDLYLRDDNPNSNNEATESRQMRGLIAMKVQFQKIEVENVRLEAFYIGFFLDNDYTVATVNNSIFYNCHQNNIYSYSNNPISGDDTAPAENYSPITLNVTNSKITKCGGPVILNQNDSPHLTKNSKSGAQITIDENTEIWTWVTGQEAWFKATNTNGTAATIATLGILLQANLDGNTFISQTGEEGTDTSNYYMNIIMLNLIAGTDAATVMKATDDLDGKLTIGGTAYFNMNDEKTATNVATGLQVGYGDQNVANAIGNYAGQAPVFNTAVGGVGVISQDEGGNYLLVTDLTADATTNAMNKEALKRGDYIALYQNNFGILLGYATHPQTN